MNNEPNNVLIDDDADINKAVDLLKVLAHPIRLKIICQLGREDKTVQQLIDCVGSTQSNVSQHLAIMRNAGILAYTKNATHVLYRVSEPTAINLVELLKKVYC